MPDNNRRSALLEELIARDGNAAAIEDLTVAEGETRVLSAKAPDMKRYFRQFRVRSVEDVKDLIGVPDRVASRNRPPNAELRAVAPLRTAAIRPMNMPARTISPEALTNAADEVERVEALSIARMAAERYVYGDSAAVLAHKGLIDKYLELRVATVFAAVFGNITVGNGATLQIAASTLVVRANKVRLHGSGRLVCDGPTTFNVQDMRGNIQPGGLLGPGSFIPGPIEPIDI